MKQLLERPIAELVELRHSVRSYEDKSISEDQMEKIKSFIEKVTNPFGKNVRIRLVHKNMDGKEVKLGTYGVIKGANTFFAVACEDDIESLLAVGYAFEQVVLYCTSLGLGTVWMGGTYKKGDFAKAMELSDNEILPMISPVGYEGGKKSFLAKVFGDHRNQRKDFETLFFDRDFEHPLTKTNAGEFGMPLEMVRLAPSAVNKQPWRVLKEGNNIHFYQAGNLKMNWMDLGIAICHFDLAAKEEGLFGKVERLEQKEHTDEKYTYAASWIME